MFFVGKVSFRPRRDFFFIHWVPTFLIFLTFAAVTAWSWQQAKDRAESDRQDALSQRAELINSKVGTRLGSHEDVLRAGAGLFRTSESVSREEWNDFSMLFELQDRYPAIHGINFITVVSPSNLQSHESAVRNESNLLKNYEVFPEGQRGIYTSVLYAEPGEIKDNLGRIGFDTYSEPKRQAAINASILSGEPAYTHIIQPIDAGNEDLPSLALFFPIFPDDRSDSTDISQIKGLIELVIKNEVIFGGLLPEEDNDNFGYQIQFLGNSENTETVYRTENFDQLKESQGERSQSHNIKISNIDLAVEIVNDKSAGTPTIQNRPDDILLAGGLISFFMAAFVYILLLSRTRAIAFKEESEIQSAKDELLALASHQLRTPATGVKQYVGMLLQGYGGKLTKDQINLLERADRSNERQLTTINEMLSVARADAGRLPIEKSRQNVSEIVNDVVEEQRSSIEKRNQKLNLHIPKAAVYADVDPRYFRMAIENIINNASKYTPEKGAIDIRLQKQKNDLIISVDDTGVGIPARHYPMLFKKFSRIPNELTSQVSGTGIGLYLAKYIVEVHGGKLTFSSEAGVGSTFKIILPFAKVHKSQ